MRETSLSSSMTSSSQASIERGDRQGQEIGQRDGIKACWRASWNITKANSPPWARLSASLRVVLTHCARRSRR